MITLNDLRPNLGAKKSPKRVGRGEGSGHGKTACRGEKGQKARSGAPIPAGFQGGQMPIYRQLPKRGFKNPFKKIYGILNVSDFAQLTSFESVDIDVAKFKGLVRKRDNLLKLLGNGEITEPVKVRVHAASKTAMEKIKAVGGTVDLVK